MESTLENSEPSNPPWEEPDTPGPFNEALILGESELLFDDTDSQGGNPGFPSFVVPETPSPQCQRRRQRYNGAENVATAALLSPPSTCGKSSPVTRSSHQSKRRKLSVPSTSVKGETSPGTSWTTNGLVSASPLLGTDFNLSTWLEPPLPSPRSSHTSSLSSLGTVSALQGVTTGDRFNFEAQELVGGPTVKHRHCKGKKCTSKQAVPTKSSSKSTANISTGDNNDSISPLATEKDKLSTHKDVHLPTTEVWLPKHEEIVISDDDDNSDVIVQGMVWSVQMEEDEAFARSLQDQFDREEQQHQDHSRQETVRTQRSHHHHHNYPYNPHLGLSWMPPWSTVADHSVLAPRFASFDAPGRNRGRGRTRGRSRHRNAHPDLDMLDPISGIEDDYEALLAFEEFQGAVVAKSSLSKRELESLPTKSYDPELSAGKTQCQICFSDYKKGEELRMLPCLHDYHLQCIDRWFKESSTCPICRADVSETIADMV